MDMLSHGAPMLLYTENRFHYIWNVIVMLSATFMAVYIPLDLRFDLHSGIILRSFYWAGSGIFIVDAVVRFFGIIGEGEEVASHRPRGARIAGWFLIDFIPAIPFGVIAAPGTLRLLRLIKLVRVGQFFRQFRQTEVRLATAIMLISFCFWVLLLIHWLGCGWMAIYGVDSNADVYTNYVSALYWVVTTLTSVGYGDIVPITNAQRLYAILVQLSGIGIFGYLIGNVVSIISREDAEKAKYSEHIEMFRTAVRRRHLPQDLQKRILDYYTYLREEKMGYDESSFLQSLPESLRSEAALELKKEFVEGIPLFKNAGQRFIAEIAPELELIVVTPGDYLFEAGDPGHEMYFIISGELDVLNRNNEVVTVLREGDFFGEIALFKSQPRSATVRADTYCNLYKLSSDTFEEIIEVYPEIAAQIMEKAQVREGRDVAE